jgi:polysaccharide export outer membrane protein
MAVGTKSRSLAAAFPAIFGQSLTARDSKFDTPPGRSSIAIRHCHVFAWMAMLVTFALTGCESAWTTSTNNSDPTTPAAVLAANFYSTNALHEGDVVEIAFQYSTNFNALQRIALDGTLNLNGIGSVKAAGKTVLELQEYLSNAYKTLAKGDVVTVNLMMNSVAIVYVSGAVLKPGQVMLDHPLTAVEAVMAAGGFDNSRASLSGVTVLRLEHGQQHAYHVNLKRTLAGKDQTPFYLRPFDIVYVPNKTFNY